MSVSNGHGYRIRFGAYEADLRSGELRRGGLKLRLQPQPFRILATLLQNPGEVVTREQLLAELWPEGTHVEFDLSLNAAVKKLRRSLGDSAQHPRFIETLPRIGYRFVFPVERIALETADDTTSSVPDAVDTDAAPARPLRWALIAATAGLAIAAGALTGVFSGDAWRALTATGQRSEEMLFAYRFFLGSRASPDGSMVAYRDAETAHLWIVDLHTGERRELIADWVSSVVAWSRDSRRIAFVKLGDPPGGLEIVEVATGARTRIPTDPVQRVVAWDWTADGRLVCTARSKDNPRIRLVGFLSLDDQVLTYIREVPQRANTFALSPDQRFIVYSERIAPTETNPAVQSDIRLIPVNGDGPIVTLSDHPDPDLYPFWSPDGRRVLVWARHESGPRERPLGRRYRPGYRRGAYTRPSSLRGWGPQRLRSFPARPRRETSSFHAGLRETTRSSS